MPDGQKCPALSRFSGKTIALKAVVKVDAMGRDYHHLPCRVYSLQQMQTLANVTTNIILQSDSVVAFGTTAKSILRLLKYFA